MFIPCLSLSYGAARQRFITSSEEKSKTYREARIWRYRQQHARMRQANPRSSPSDGTVTPGGQQLENLTRRGSQVESVSPAASRGALVVPGDVVDDMEVDVSESNQVQRPRTPHHLTDNSVGTTPSTRFITSPNAFAGQSFGPNRGAFPTVTQGTSPFSSANVFDHSVRDQPDAVMSNGEAVEPTRRRSKSDDSMNSDPLSSSTSRPRSASVNMELVSNARSHSANGNSNSGTALRGRSRSLARSVSPGPYRRRSRSRSRGGGHPSQGRSRSRPRGHSRRRRVSHSRSVNRRRRSRSRSFRSATAGRSRSCTTEQSKRKRSTDRRNTRRSRHRSRSPEFTLSPPRRRSPSSSSNSNSRLGHDPAESPSPRTSRSRPASPGPSQAPDSSAYLDLLASMSAMGIDTKRSSSTKPRDRTPKGPSPGAPVTGDSQPTTPKRVSRQRSPDSSPSKSRSKPRSRRSHSNRRSRSPSKPLTPALQNSVRCIAVSISLSIFSVFVCKLLYNL